MTMIQSVRPFAAVYYVHATRAYYRLVLHAVLCIRHNAQKLHVQSIAGSGTMIYSG